MDTWRVEFDRSCHEWVIVHRLTGERHWYLCRTEADAECRDLNTAIESAQSSDPPTC